MGAWDSVSPTVDSVWGFRPNGNGSGSWTEILGFVGEKPFPSDIHGTSDGMFTNDDNNAYYLDGNISNTSSPSVPSAYRNTGLLRLNFETLTLTNSSELGLAFSKGVLLNVPVYGVNGVLVNFGGGDEKHGAGFNNINVFDKKEQKWYNQTAEGDIPRPRYLFCAVGVQGEKHTSYEM